MRLPLRHICAFNLSLPDFLTCKVVGVAVFLAVGVAVLLAVGMLDVR